MDHNPDQTVHNLQQDIIFVTLNKYIQTVECKKVYVKSNLNNFHMLCIMQEK